MWGRPLSRRGCTIANGLIVLAIVQGEGPLWSGVAFWLLAQVVLIVAGLLYEWITPHSVHSELERDNAAVGLAFGGVLVGMGNIVSIAVAGDYAGWLIGLQTFGIDVVFGFVALYGIHKLTDALLAPSVRLGAEQVEEQPNVGGRADRGFWLRGRIDANRLDLLNYPVGSDATATAGPGRRGRLGTLLPSHKELMSMKSVAVCLFSLLVSVSAASADEPTVSGQVRLVDGSAVAGAQVMLFDVSDLRRGAVGRATTDGSGRFALSLAGFDKLSPQLGVSCAAAGLCAGAELSESV